MYTAQMTKERVKSLCKNKKINMEQMLIECSLGVNAIRQINDTKGMASFSLAKIADYLDCSVDYLLGRTDSPEISQNYSNNSISNSNNVAIASGDANNITISNGNQKSEKDQEDMELMELIKSLPLKKRVKIISMIYEEIEEK